MALPGMSPYDTASTDSVAPSGERTATRRPTFHAGKTQISVGSRATSGFIETVSRQHNAWFNAAADGTTAVLDVLSMGLGPLGRWIAGTSGVVNTESRAYKVAALTANIAMVVNPVRAIGAAAMGAARAAQSAEAVGGLAKTVVTQVSEGVTAGAAEGVQTAARILPDVARRPVLNAVLKGEKALSELTSVERTQAAAFFRDVAGKGLAGANAEAARVFNLERAEFLEGTSNVVPGQLIDSVRRQLLNVLRTRGGP
jgi:hypothetical protein